MRARDTLDLLLLAAIWGASFLFMRIAVPAFGPVPLAFIRVVGAALLLLPLLALRGELSQLWPRAPRLLLVGMTNSALPFICFGYATLSITAGLASIFNAATPLTSALFAWAWLKEPMTRWRTLGLALGFAGVLGLAWNKAGGSLLGTAAGGAASAASNAVAGGLDLPVLLAIAACLTGTLLYGFSASFTKRHLQGTPAMVLAAGSQAAAALLLLPLAVAQWPATMPGALPWAAAIASALLSSGVAYVLYFRLIANVGPTNAASVTFLIPVFAVAWGAWLLGEVVSWAMVAGGLVIVAGTALVLGLWPRRP